MYNEREQGRRNVGRESDCRFKDVVVGGWCVPVWACNSYKAGLRMDWGGRDD